MRPLIIEFWLDSEGDQIFFTTQVFPMTGVKMVSCNYNGNHIFQCWNFRKNAFILKKTFMETHFYQPVKIVCFDWMHEEKEYFKSSKRKKNHSGH